MEAIKQTTIVDEVNQEFRKNLERLEAEGISVKQIIDEVNSKFFDVGCYLLGKKAFPIFIKPYFVTRERINYVDHVTHTIMKVLEKVTDLYFTNEEIRPLFELTEAETELVQIDPGYPLKIRITRNDAFLTDDYLKMIEFNTDSPGGPMYSDFQTELIGKSRAMDALWKKYDFHLDKFIPQVLRTLLAAYWETGGRKDHPFIALVAGDDSATWPEFELIVQWLKERGYGSAVSDSRWLTYDGEHLLTRDGEAVDIIYRRGWLPNWTDHMDEIKPLIKAYCERKVCVVNSPRTILASNKSLLHVIQREEMQYLFSKTERKVIRENVPWTRVLKEGSTTDPSGEKVDLYSFAENNRSRLVIKPYNQFGGKDVCVGPDATDETWRQWLDKSHKQQLYVIQEYVHIPEEDFPEAKPDLKYVPKKINVNFFAYNGNYAGGMVRTSESSIINISAGGGLVPILVIEGRK